MEATKKDSPKEHSSQEGASMVEYALIAVLIAVVCISAITFMGKSTSKSFSQVGSSFNNNN